MRKAIGLILLACMAVAAVAQQPQPAKYLWIEHVQLNTGKHLQFQDMVRQVRLAATDIAPGLHWMAASPLTGDARQMSIMIPHNTLGELDQTLQAMMKIEQAVLAKNVNLADQAAETEAGARFTLAKFRPELSYKFERINPAFTTRWQQTILYLKPGTDTEFTDLMKHVLELENQAADPNAKWMLYEVMGGTSMPAYVIVTPLKTLADLDVEPPESAKQVYNESVVRMLQTSIKSSVVNMESNVMLVRPDLSRPPEALVAANPDFWTVKEPAPVVATKMVGKKKVKVEEAEMVKPPKK
ncbi:MAG TPA: hypothetical protein VFU76_12800 [Terriglobales bacterium]|nr:hypothetical protein [Terriglobales bacterium]